MNKIRKSILGGLFAFAIALSLTSCDSFKLSYDYSESFGGYTVYSEESTLNRLTYMGEIDISSIYSFTPVVGVSSYAFYRCENVKKVNLSNNTKEIGACAFSKCKSLESISLPSGLEIIDSCAFKDAGLKNVWIPASVSFVGIGAYAACPIETITIDKNNKVFDTKEDINAIIYKENMELVSGCKKTKIPEGVKKISPYAFYGIDELTIDIPSSVERIEENAFSKGTTINYPGTYDEFLQIFELSIDSALGITVVTKDQTYTFN